MFLIALGANLPSTVGPPRETLTAALELLRARGIPLRARSRWFRTPAHPPGSGPDFVNAAAAVEAALEPPALLAALHAVERELGRTRRRRWEARVCDLDLLAADDIVLPDAATARHWMARPAEDTPPAPPALVLPHPRLHERAFVLAPLADVAPRWVHPLTGRTAQQMLAALPAEARAGIAAMAPDDG